MHAKITSMVVSLLFVLGSAAWDPQRARRRRSLNGSRRWPSHPLICRRSAKP